MPSSSSVHSPHRRILAHQLIESLQRFAFVPEGHVGVLAGVEGPALLVALKPVDERGVLAAEVRLFEQAFLDRAVEPAPEREIVHLLCPPSSLHTLRGKM